MKGFENKGSFQGEVEWSMSWNKKVNMDHSILFSKDSNCIKTFRNVFLKSHPNKGNPFGEPGFLRGIIFGDHLKLLRSGVTIVLLKWRGNF